MTPKEIHKTLADQGIRIFSIRLQSSYGHEIEHWIHPTKTVKEWREDISQFLIKVYDDEDDLFNAFYDYLHKLGYVEMMDVVADVFEGAVQVGLKAQILPDPEHEEDETGFGHYGWENKG